MKDLIESNNELYDAIDRCIDAIIKARLAHDVQGEGKALFQMECLMVATQQQLSYINKRLQDSSAERKLDAIREAIDNSLYLQDIVEKIKEALKEK